MGITNRCENNWLWNLKTPLRKKKNHIQNLTFEDKKSESNLVLWYAGKIVLKKDRGVSIVRPYISELRTLTVRLFSSKTGKYTICAEIIPISIIDHTRGSSQFSKKRPNPKKTHFFSETLH
jgi:hypothetical protein